MPKNEIKILEHSSYPALVCNAITLMERDFARMAGVDELAERLGVTKCHLIRTFSDAVGISPGQFLTKIRLKNAKLYLCSRQYPLETVAGLVGFAGANYFCKVFRKATGMTPGEYRAQYAQNDAVTPVGEEEFFV